MPEVFHDKIAPSEAPAAIGSATAEQAAQKQQAVIVNIQRRAEDIAPHVSTQPAPQDVHEHISSINQAIQSETDRITKLNQPGILSKIPGIGAIATKIREGRRQAATAAKEQAEAVRDQAQSDLEAAQMYTKEYLGKQSDPNRVQELIKANQRGGPMAVSPEMTRALEQQAQIKKELSPVAELRQIYERRIGGVPKDMLPSRILEEINSAVRSSETGLVFSREDVEAAVLTATAFHETAMEYSDSHTIEVDQNLYVKAFGRGVRINREVWGGTGANVYDFVGRKIGENTGEYPYGRNLGQFTWYTMGGAQLEDFFQRSGIPAGEQRIPYIIAYAAGMTVSKHPINVGVQMRDWIAECMPYEDIKNVRKNGVWEEEKQPAKPRGLGSFITLYERFGSRQLQETGTDNEALTRVFDEATKIVRSIDSNLLRYNVRSREILGAQYIRNIPHIKKPALTQ